MTLGTEHNAITTRGISQRLGRMVRFVVLLWSVAAGSIANAQEVLFTRDHGGDRQDGSYAIEATRDGGFINAGFTKTYSPNSGTAMYLVKTDGKGLMEWSRSYELSQYETIGAAVRELPGGGYAIAGRAGINGSFDSFLIRTDEQGETLWHELYDAGADDRAHAMALTPDGGFILAGQAWFGDQLFGNYDLYVVKTDANGAVEWTRVFEYDDGFGAGADIAFSIESVSAGGYIIGGYTQSSVWDGWVIRIDELGTKVWDRLYSNGGGSDAIRSVREVPAGGFVLGGLFATHQGDVDLALVRTDEFGEPLWSRTFGSLGLDEQGTCVRLMPDGGFVLAGMSASWGQSWDMSIVRTDADGNVLWSKEHGGTSDDRAWSVAVGRDAIVAAGWAWSSGAGLGDVHLAAFGDPSLGCTADFNHDGAVNTQDVLAFLNAWAAGDASADFNGDGSVNTQDVLAFLNAWNTGC